MNNYSMFLFLLFFSIISSDIKDKSIANNNSYERKNNLMGDNNRIFNKEKRSQYMITRNGKDISKIKKKVLKKVSDRKNIFPLFVEKPMQTEQNKLSFKDKFLEQKKEEVLLNINLLYSDFQYYEEAEKSIKNGLDIYKDLLITLISEFKEENEFTNNDANNFENGQQLFKAIINKILNLNSFSEDKIMPVLFYQELIKLLNNIIIDPNMHNNKKKLLLEIIDNCKSIINYFNYKFIGVKNYFDNQIELLKNNFNVKFNMILKKERSLRPLLFFKDEWFKNLEEKWNKISLPLKKESWLMIKGFYYEKKKKIRESYINNNLGLLEIMIILLNNKILNIERGHFNDIKIYNENKIKSQEEKKKLRESYILNNFNPLLLNIKREHFNDIKIYNENKIKSQNEIILAHNKIVESFYKVDSYFSNIEFN